MARRPPNATGSSGRPPGTAELVRLGLEVLAELPDYVRVHIGDVPVRVEDFADDETLRELGIDDPFALSGLYRGVPIGDKESMAVPSGIPDMIFLYRRPILDEWCEEDVPLKDVVRTVLVHEIGHHLGLSDEDIDRIEEQARQEDEG
jgi:predicted Zn-dependent protease with MMP-like domain